MTVPMTSDGRKQFQQMTTMTLLRMCFEPSNSMFLNTNIENKGMLSRLYGVIGTRHVANGTKSTCVAAHECPLQLCHQHLMPLNLLVWHRQVMQGSYGNVSSVLASVWTGVNLDLSEKGDVLCCGVWFLARSGDYKPVGKWRIQSNLHCPLAGR